MNQQAFSIFCEILEFNIIQGWEIIENLEKHLREWKLNVFWHLIKPLSVLH